MEKLDLRYTTKSERKYIAEAIKIIDKIYDSHNKIESRTCYLWGGKFLDKGWSLKGGAFKKAFMKGQVVAKIGPSIQLKREMLLWKKTRLEPDFRKYRKNLARIFGVYRGFMIQRKVPKSNAVEANCPYPAAGKFTCEKVAKALKIEDWWHNHGHDKYGNPIFFDTIVDHRGAI